MITKMCIKCGEKNKKTIISPEHKDAIIRMIRTGEISTNTIVKVYPMYTRWQIAGVRAHVTIHSKLEKWGF
jgi:hypothetical protein